MKRAERDAEFTAFVLGQSARLATLAAFLTPEHQRSEDLLQAELERTYVRWPHVRQHDPVGYVRRGLVNANTDWWRRGTRREQPVEMVPEQAADVDHARDVSERDAVLRAISGLTARERAVVVLRYYEDLPEAEIAALLGIASGTVKSACARALTRLRLAPDLVESAEQYRLGAAND